MLNMFGPRNAGCVLKLVFFLFILLSLYYCVDKIINPKKSSGGYERSYSYKTNKRTSDIGTYPCKIVLMTKKGQVSYKTNSEWKSCDDNTLFNKSVSLKTTNDSWIKTGLELESEFTKIKDKFAIEKSFVKLFPNTELTINAANNDKTRNTIELQEGEINFKVSIDGKNSFKINIGNINVEPIFGQLKVLYNKENNEGVIVVQTGEANVYVTGQEFKKIDSFRKIEFKNEVLGEKKQASMLQYKWE